MAVIARWTRILAAAFWFIWTGVIIPGHTRGAIQMPGGESHSCCHSPLRSNSSDSGKSSCPDSSNCAICAVAAKLRNESLPPPQVLKLPFAYRAIIPKAAEAPALELILSFHTRGPPDSSTANT